LYRCILEIVNCALYLSRQGGDFGADTVIAILTTNNFNNISHPLVTETLSASKQEGTVEALTVISFLTHIFILVSAWITSTLKFCPIYNKLPIYFENEKYKKSMLHFG